MKEYQKRAKERTEEQKAKRAAAEAAKNNKPTDPPPDDIDGIDLPLPAPWPVLRREAYHGVVGEIVQTIAPESEADPVGLLTQVLVACGSAIGRTAQARVEGDAHHCNLFAITVGKSGHGRKGVAWGRTHGQRA